MNYDKKIDEIDGLLSKAINELDKVTACLVDALTHIHERLENIEKWIFEQKENLPD